MSNSKPIKDSYTREEVIELITKFDIEAGVGDHSGPSSRQKWLDKNL